MGGVALLNKWALWNFAVPWTEQSFLASSLCHVLWGVPGTGTIYLKSLHNRVGDKSTIQAAIVTGNRPGPGSVWCFDMCTHCKPALPRSLMCSFSYIVSVLSLARTIRSHSFLAIWNAQYPFIDYSQLPWVLSGWNFTIFSHPLPTLLSRI